MLAPNDIAIDNRIVLGMNGGYAVMLFSLLVGF
jgi:hypothetical protein